MKKITTRITNRKTVFHALFTSSHVNEWMCVSCVRVSQCSWTAGRAHWTTPGVCKGSCVWAKLWCCYCGWASDAPASESSLELCWVGTSPAAVPITHNTVGILLITHTVHASLRKPRKYSLNLFEHNKYKAVIFILFEGRHHLICIVFF